MKWAQFFEEYYSGESSPERDATLKGLWANAETASTEYGRTVAERQGLRPTGGEKAVYEGASVWRDTVRFGTTPLTLGFLYAGMWPELFDPRVPWQFTMDYTMRIYLSGM
jgi:hypothetical protein